MFQRWIVERQRRRDEEQCHRRQAGGRNPRWHPIQEEQRGLKAHYIGLMNRTQGRNEGVFGRAAFDNKVDYTQAMVTRQPGLNVGYFDAYIKNDPTPFFEHRSSYRSMPFGEVIVILSLQEAKFCGKILYQHGIHGCRAVKAFRSWWVDCVKEASPGAQRIITSMGFGHPYSWQAAITHTMMTATATADYFSRYIGMGNVAASGSPENSWRHNVPGQTSFDITAASFNQEEVDSRREFTHFFGDDVITRADAHTVSWGTVMGHSLQFRYRGFDNMVVFTQSIIDDFFGPDAHFLDSEMTVYVNIAKFAGFIWGGR